jgi:hypothetical protein
MISGAGANYSHARDWSSSLHLHQLPGPRSIHGLGGHAGTTGKPFAESTAVSGFLRQPPLPRRQGRQRCPEPVSEICVAQPPLSLDQLRPGDTLVVWRLDRLGRSLRHLVDTITSLADRGVGFRSLQEAIDTTTPGGKLVFHVFAALAEFERDLIRERTSAGLAAARALGRHGGRPPVLSGHKLQVAKEMYRSGQDTMAAIAKALGVSRASIYRHLTGDGR